MKVTINIDGKKYPCYETMGAQRRFYAEVGKDITEVDLGKEGYLLGVYAWCCAASACKRDGIVFDISLEDFLDNLDIPQVAKWMLDKAEADKKKLKELGVEASKKK